MEWHSTESKGPATERHSYELKGLAMERMGKARNGMAKAEKSLTNYAKERLGVELNGKGSEMSS